VPRARPVLLRVPRVARLRARLRVPPGVRLRVPPGVRLRVPPGVLRVELWEEPQEPQEPQEQQAQRNP